MNQPLLHPRTKKQLELYLANPSHAVVLAGPTGIGKDHLAIWLSDQLQSDYHLVEKQEKLTTITIEQIRELYNLTKTGRKQVIVISEAQSMVEAAQNAFLKLLEEPPENTHFILTTTQKEGLLPTIRSRATQLEIIPPNEADFIAYFDNNQTDFLQIVRATGYLPAKVATLLADQAEKEQFLTQLTEVKQFYAAKSYERHLTLITHSYDRAWLEQFLTSLNRIIESLINLRSQDRAALAKLTKQAQLINQTLENIIQKPGNPKIHLTHLAEML